MRKMKKAAGIVLAVIMALSLCMSISVNTYADNDGSITITNATAGETYNIYRLLDLTYAAGNTSYSYTVADGWETFFTSGAGAGYVSVDQTTGHVTWTGGGTGTGSQAAALATAALAYAEANKISPTATATAVAGSTTLTFSGLAYGYYLIDSSLGSLLTLDSTAPSVEVEDKNSKPSGEKTVKEDSTGIYGESNTADIGEEVSFRVEITNAYGASNLVLHDTMSEGLTLNENSFTIKVGSSLASADATVSDVYYDIITTGLTDGCTFEIAFKDEYVQTILTESQVLVVEYTATVNSKAVIASTGNTNETQVSYGNASKSTKDTTITYVYELYVYKYTTDSNSAEVALSDAKFILYKEVNGTNYYAVLDNDNKILRWSITKGDATELTTGSDGVIYFIGLDAGTYLLEETEAPTGYNLLNAPTTIVIAQDGTITGAQTIKYNGDDQDAIKIYNGSLDEMPSTGGMGTRIFYTLGGLLVVCAGVLLITKRRMGR